MKSFQIRTKENKAISLNQLDEEAAQLWGKSVSNKKWAFPFELTNNMLQNIMISSLNWFDIIGFAIARKPVTTWDDVINNMTEDSGEEGYEPFMDLISLWKGKGYIPVTL